MSFFEKEYKENLITRIRDLIDGYTKDSILKEFLQNADDSGATELIVTYDGREHAALFSTEFEAAKGPALLVQNNASFKDKDFESITEIGAQGKSDDSASTGRFGQGFSSSFSVSDHPSFISSGRAYWFDVLKQAVSKGKKSSIIGWHEDSFDEISNWISTFKFTLFDKSAKTIFRLPLRNNETSKSSLISNEIFTIDDFYKWCDEWRVDYDNLLFLRHVNKLTLQEITSDGTKIIHLQISTLNDQQIDTLNKEIEKEFGQTPLETCEAWLKSKGNLPYFKYHHEFEILYFDRNENKIERNHQKWAVANGLFRGDDNSLIHQAIKALSIEKSSRKVLPWAGVAIKLNEDNLPQKVKGKTFTFLPLPIHSLHPVHIHGWFDLNPKRTELTFDGSGQDKDILIKWNEMLLVQAVGKIWADLLAFIKDEHNAKAYYDLWLRKEDTVFDEFLSKGFYSSIVKLNSVLCTNVNGQSWLSPLHNTPFVFKKSNENLLDAFIHHFEIMQPTPPSFILKKFKSINQNIEEITPESIRCFIGLQTQDIEYPIDFGKMPLAMLNELSWFSEILTYCAGEDNDYSLIDNLPLELTEANNIYKINIPTIFQKKPEIELFQDKACLFISTGIVETIERTELLPKSWLLPTPKNVLSVIYDNIDEFDVNKDWIVKLIEYMCNQSDEDFREAYDVFSKLKILKTVDDGLISLDNEESHPLPILIKKEDIANIKFLTLAKISLIHPEFLDVYRPLLKKGVLHELSSAVLIEHLLMIEEHSFFKKPEAREYLLSVLTENIDWINSIKQNDAKFNVFCEIPFIQTENDNLHSVNSNKNIYLPSDFSPPNHISSLSGDYELIRLDHNNLRELLKECSIEEQTFKNYLIDVIIPFLEKTSNKEERNFVLIWLAETWDKLAESATPEEVELLLALLKTSLIIPNFNQTKTLKPTQYYHPHFFSSLPKFLRNEQFCPVIFEKHSKAWLRFLRELGTADQIMPLHILGKVNDIIEDGIQGSAIDLLNYISNKFEVFEYLEYEDNLFLDTLGKMPWFPTAKPNKLLKPSHEYNKLDYPNKLILERHLNVAGGAHYSLHRAVRLGKKDIYVDINEIGMAKKLGVLTSLPVTSVFESFESLTKIEPKSSIEQARIRAYATDFYKYIGRKKVSTIPDRIKNSSIRIQDNWVASSQTFQVQTNLSGIYYWENVINGEKDQSLKDGLELLGVKSRPSVDFLIDRLLHIPILVPLNKLQIRDTKCILNELQQNRASLPTDISIPLLAKSNMLFDCDNLFIDDLPSFNHAQIKNEELALCNNLYYSLGKQLKVKSLAEVIDGQIWLDETVISSEISERAILVQSNLQSEYLKTAIIRLNYHEGKISDNEIHSANLNEVIPRKIQFYEKLAVNYFADNLWVYGDDSATAFSDSQEKTLHILNQDDVEDMCESISEHITSNAKLSIESYSIISRILRNDINGKEIIAFLDKKKIKSLPDKFNIEEDDVLIEEQVDFSTIEQEYENQVETNVVEKKAKSATRVQSLIRDAIRPSVTRNDIVENKSEYSQGSSTNNRTSHSASSNSKLDSHPKTNIFRPESISSNRRLPVYAGKPMGETSCDGESTSAQKIGSRGEDYIIENQNQYLLSPHNSLKKMQINNEGFDILETNKDGDIVRYIEVKTLTGPWGDGGVSVTLPQVAFAYEHKNWWLIVVENLNDEPVEVHQLNNPILEMNKVMFDCSWKNGVI